MMEVMAVVSAGSENIAYDRIALAMFDILDTPGFSCELYWAEDKSKPTIQQVFVIGVNGGEWAFVVEADYLTPVGFHVADITVFGSEAYRSDWLKVVGLFMVQLDDIIAEPVIKW